MNEEPAILQIVKNIFLSQRLGNFLSRRTPATNYKPISEILRIHGSNRKKAKSQSSNEDPFQFFLPAIASLIQIHQEQKMEKKSDGLAMICRKWDMHILKKITGKKKREH